MMRFDIGFDIGGSHIAGGIYDEGHNCTKTVEEPFPKGRPDEAPALIAAMAEKLMEGTPRESVAGLGLAVPGSLDLAAGKVVHAWNLGFHDFPLRSLVQALIPSIPVYIANDADAAALAELYAGAFRGAKSAVLLTLGTGVGGGIILNGKLFTGGMGNGVELGHIILDMSGEMCSCGYRGCCESRCSATALIRDGVRAMEANPESALYKKARGEAKNIDARMVIDCAREGDAAAMEAFSRYTGSLAAAATSVINILDPEVIAFGGGVSGAGDFLLAPVRAIVDKTSFFEKHARIEKAQLGNSAGMLGAAMLRADAER